MKGRNKLVLCQAAMKEAIGYWLDNKVFRDIQHEVESVEAKNGSFEIKVQYCHEPKNT